MILNQSTGLVAAQTFSEGLLASTEPVFNATTPSRQTLERECTVSVIIPTKNEARNLKHVLPFIPAWVHEIIIVDAHSTDGTVQEAQRLCQTVRILEQQGRGKGAALRTGFAAANGDIIVMLDGDGSMNPREIPAYIGALLTGADFAKGSRFIQGGGTYDMSWLRYLGNWFFTSLVKLLYGCSYSDLCYGYNAFWKRILPRLYLDVDGFEIETLMNIRVLQARFKVAEVPSFEAKRVCGDSNLRTFPDGWRVLLTILREWSERYQQKLLDVPADLAMSDWMLKDFVLHIRWSRPTPLSHPPVYQPPG